MLDFIRNIFYTNVARALALGFTHHGMFFGVALWVRVNPEGDYEMTVKSPILGIFTIPYIVFITICDFIACRILGERVATNVGPERLRPIEFAAPLMEGAHAVARWPVVTRDMGALEYSVVSGSLQAGDYIVEGLSYATDAGGSVAVTFAVLRVDGEDGTLRAVGTADLRGQTVLWVRRYRVGEISSTALSRILFDGFVPLGDVT